MMKKLLTTKSNNFHTTDMIIFDPFAATYIYIEEIRDAAKLEDNTSYIHTNPLQITRQSCRNLHLGKIPRAEKFFEDFCLREYRLSPVMIP